MLQSESEKKRKTQVIQFGSQTNFFFTDLQTNVSRTTELNIDQHSACRTNGCITPHIQIKGKVVPLRHEGACREKSTAPTLS